MSRFVRSASFFRRRSELKAVLTALRHSFEGDAPIVFQGQVQTQPVIYSTCLMVGVGAGTVGYPKTNLDQDPLGSALIAHFQDVADKKHRPRRENVWRATSTIHKIGGN
jgi:hypothetical protein